MTTLQEAAMRDALEAAQKFCAKVEAGNARSTETYADMKRIRNSLIAALAQQVEQRPVAWAIFTDEGNARMWSTLQPHVQRLADAEGLSVTPLYTAAPAPVAQEPATDEFYTWWGEHPGLSKTQALREFSAPAPQPAVRSARAAFESSVRCGDMYEYESYTAGYEQGKYDEQMYQGPAPQPAQDGPEVGFGTMPPKFLANGTRFKTSKFPGGVCITGMPDELAGRWVALVAAEDNCHLQSAQPVAQPLHLSAHDIQVLWDSCDADWPQHYAFARAIEAAHGIK